MVYLIQILTIGFIITFSSNHLFAATYWVSADGTKTSKSLCQSEIELDGSSACTWQTAMKEATAGEVWYFRGGNYYPKDELLRERGISESAYWVHNAMEPYHSGRDLDSSGTVEEDEYILFKAYEKERVFIADDSETDQYGAFGVTSQSYIIWDGFSTDVIDYPVIDKGMYLDDSNHIIIRNCDFEGNGNSKSNNGCISFKGATYIYIENNKFYGAENDLVNAAGLLMYHTRHVYIRHNDFYNSSNGIKVKHDNDYTYIYNNYFYDIENDAIVLNRDWTHAYVYNNIIRSSRVCIYNQSYHQSGELNGPGYFYNNTCFQNAANGQGWNTEEDNDTGDSVVFNNIFYNINRAVRAYSSRHTINHNAYFNASEWHWNGQKSFSVSAWKSSSGQDLHYTMNNPNFDIQGAIDSPIDFKLRIDSPEFYKSGGKGGTYPNYIGAWEWPPNSNQKIGYSGDGPLLGETPSPPQNLRVVN